MSEERRKAVWPRVVALVVVLLANPLPTRFWAWAVFLAAVEALLMATVALYATIRDGDNSPASFLSVVAILAVFASYVLRPWAKRLPRKPSRHEQEKD